jgi:hypothetical protein
VGQDLRRPNKCQKRPTIGAKETYYVRTFECLLISGSGYDRRRPHILLSRAPPLCLVIFFFQRLYKRRPHILLSRALLMFGLEVCLA